jgi:hypothetical protein
MPVRVEKRGSKFVATDPSGRIYGTHSSREKAERQRRAIEASKHGNQRKLGR